MDPGISSIATNISAMNEYDSVSAQAARSVLTTDALLTNDHNERRSIFSVIELSPPPLTAKQRERLHPYVSENRYSQLAERSKVSSARSKEERHEIRRRRKSEAAAQATAIAEAAAAAMAEAAKIAFAARAAALEAARVAAEDTETDNSSGEDTDNDGGHDDLTTVGVVHASPISPPPPSPLPPPPLPPPPPLLPPPLPLVNAFTVQEMPTVPVPASSLTGAAATATVLPKTRKAPVSGTCPCCGRILKLPCTMNSTAMGVAVMAEPTALLQFEQAVGTGHGGLSAFRACSYCSKVYKAALAVAQKKWTNIPELRTGPARRNDVVVLETPFLFGSEHATLVS